MRINAVAVAVAVAALGTSAAARKQVVPRRPGPLTLTIAPSGSALDLTFSNPTAAAIAFPIRMNAGRIMYDWLEVTLTPAIGTGGDARAIHFTGVRDKSVEQMATVAAGGRVTEHVELAAWAFEGAAEPLAPGTYHALATWTQVGRDGPELHLTATTDLTIAAPVDGSCTQKPGAAGAVELLARQVGTTAEVELGLHNTGATPVCVATRVLAGEAQSDWLTLTIDKRVLALTGPRHAAVRVTSLLAPGATSWTRFDLDHWATRSGGKRLPRTGLWIEAAYDSTHETTVWPGTARTGFGVTLR